ncbi:MAG: molybdopterin-synthase adenylyltransferase MoeB [Flammeovirgaceae bacterium]|nr:molybdopterin-synthase adenylyltransferase MoeB [Flammeovirgaceae bacterium]
MKDNALNKEEYKRYSRHLVLKDFGEKGQLRLKNSSVLVVGSGGLGSPVLSYLTAAGVGRIGIADFDSVSISNLQRQVLFCDADIDMNKAERAVHHLQLLNPLIQFQSIDKKIDSSNALEILKGFDVIVDCTDNFPTRYLLNDASILLNIPLVFGSIHQYEGQVSVFNVQKPDGSFSSSYRDLFPHPPEPGSVPDCSEAGVLGVLPGIIGSLQANEAIKLLTQTGELLTDKLLIFDSQCTEFTTVEIPNRNSRDSISDLIDYEAYCNSSNAHQAEVSVLELQKFIASKKEFVLIDIRPTFEFEAGNLGGINIPMDEIPNSIDLLSKKKKTIIHCKHGTSSAKIINWLNTHHGYSNLINLKGGIQAWKNQIDNSIEVL